MNYVAVIIDGSLSIHLPHPTGNYLTLCGIDGDDPKLNQAPSRVPHNARIDCLDCFNIWKVASGYSISDFTATIQKERQVPQ